MLAAVGRLPEIPARIRALAEIADLVFVDMPPSRTAGFDELLAAADWVIVPTQLERLSLEGVGLLAQALSSQTSNVKRQNVKRDDGPRLMGIMPNMTRASTREHQAQMVELVRAFGQAVWPPLPLTIKVTEAATYGTTVFELCPGEPVTEAMLAVKQRMLGVLKENRERKGGLRVDPAVAAFQRRQRRMRQRCREATEGPETDPGEVRS
jgi:cellulose biosynthesis protein BcsQ